MAAPYAARPGPVVPRPQERSVGDDQRPGRSRHHRGPIRQRERLRPRRRDCQDRIPHSRSAHRREATGQVHRRGRQPPSGSREGHSEPEDCALLPVARRRSRQDNGKGSGQSGESRSSSHPTKPRPTSSSRPCIRRTLGSRGRLLVRQPSSKHRSMLAASTSSSSLAIRPWTFPTSSCERAL